MEIEILTTWLTLIVGMGMALSPIVSGFVAATKTAMGEWLLSRYYPTVSVACGIVLAQFVGWILGIGWRECLLIGAIAGFSAAGLFNYGKSTEATSSEPSPRP